MFCTLMSCMYDATALHAPGAGSCAKPTLVGTQAPFRPCPTGSNSTRKKAADAAGVVQRNSNYQQAAKGSAGECASETKMLLMILSSTQDIRVCYLAVTDIHLEPLLKNEKNTQHPQLQRPVSAREGEFEAIPCMVPSHHIDSSESEVSTQCCRPHSRVSLRNLGLLSETCKSSTDV